MYDIFHYAKGISITNSLEEKKKEDEIDNLTKPVGSLGKLEEIVIRLAGILGTQDIQISKKAVVIMCSDNGVCEEGVSECPKEVTYQVTSNFARGITGVNRMSLNAQSDIYIVDIGVEGELSHPLIHNKKIRHGTANMCKELPMTREEVLQAINVGIEAAEELIGQGYQVLGTGEMGIGNTTTSAAVLAVLTGKKVNEVTGKGAGAKQDTLLRKVKVIEKAISLHKPNKEDVIDVLSKVGGLDLAGLCGVFLGAAKNKKPVVIDGFISAVAAVCAYKIEPKTALYMFPSHLSKENGMTLALETLGMKAYFDLDMRLGEGTGCTLTFQLMDMALYTLSTMGTFEEAAISKEPYMGIWKEK